MSVTKLFIKKFNYLILLCLVMGSFFSTTVMAQSGVFQVALKAAKRGDYGRAVELFEALYNHGDINPNLIYNLASCHYRLGNMAQAHDYFSKLLDDEKYQSLAAYNMGLIEAKLGDDVAAIHSFQRSLRATSPDNVALINLNRKALRIISNRNVSYLGGANKPWFASISSSLSYDNNAQLAGNELLQTTDVKEADTVWSTMLTAQSVISGSRKNGFKLGAFYNALRYQSVDANSTLYTVFLSRVSSWLSDSKGELGLEVSRQNYLVYRDNYYSASYRWITRFGEKNRLDLSYRYQWVEPEQTTEYWRGSSQDIKTRFTLGELGNSVTLTMKYAINRRNDKIDNEPISFSPIRVGYDIAYFYKKLKHAYGFTVGYLVSRYRGDSSYDGIDDVGNPVVVIEHRQDRKKVFSAFYRYTITRKLQCSLNFYRQLNQSNISSLSYQQSMIGSEIMYTF